MTNSNARHTRRTLIRAAGAGTLPALTGCAGGGRDGDGPYGGWLDDATGFDGVADRTGRSEIGIAVGAGGGFAFDPVAVRIDPGTTVVWEWTGKGGTHNVKDVDGAFESDLAVEAGHTFSHAFDAAGVYTYVCEPHRTTGMKGVVEVVE